MSDVGDLGRRVTERRSELRLSTEVVAARAGMDPSYLHSLEVSPSPDLSRAALWRLAAALDTSVDDLTGGGTQAPPGRADPQGNPVLIDLDRAECQSLISPGGVGRVVFGEPRGPVALPVNFRILDNEVVFRTAPLPTLTSSLGRRPVSFEVDHLDEALAEGWSVLVSGEGHVIVEAAELEQARALNIAPWAGGERDIYVRISPVKVTGRRIRQSSDIGG
jgi:transcriptional regulator with XRE-family HTH domain